jgi:hypothetical protein
VGRYAIIRYHCIYTVIYCNLFVCTRDRWQENGDSRHLFLSSSVTDPRHRNESSHRRRHRHRLRHCRRHCNLYCHRHCPRHHILENFQLRSATVEDLLSCSRLRLQYTTLLYIFRKRWSIPRGCTVNCVKVVKMTRIRIKMLSQSILRGEEVRHLLRRL